MSPCAVQKRPVGCLEVNIFRASSSVIPSVPATRPRKLFFRFLVAISYVKAKKLLKNRNSGKMLKIKIQCLQMLVTFLRYFLDEMSAYAFLVLRFLGFSNIFWYILVFPRISQNFLRFSRIFGDLSRIFKDFQGYSRILT